MSTLEIQQAAMEQLGPEDPYFNYCLWPYEPVQDGVGQLRASSLLFRAIQEMDSSDWLYAAIRAIQAGIGDFRSVYGIKFADGQWSLEVYLYDYERQDRIVSIERLMASCGQFLTLPTTVSPSVPYFMFSFDLDSQVAKQGGAIDVVHVYIGNPGSTVSSGICYAHTHDPKQTRLENFYFFFDANDVQAICDKICCSVFLNEEQSLLDTVYRPELARCQTVCLANKPKSNTVYYSGIDLSQLLSFLAWQKYPASFAEFVEAHQDRLKHLRFDVGVDYTVCGDDVVMLKSGIYGCF